MMRRTSRPPGSPFADRRSRSTPGGRRGDRDDQPDGPRDSRRRKGVDEHEVRARRCERDQAEGLPPAARSVRSLRARHPTAKHARYDERADDQQHAHCGGGHENLELWTSKVPGEDRDDNGECDGRRRQATTSDPRTVAKCGKNPLDDDDRGADAHGRMEDRQVDGEKQVRVPDLTVGTDPDVLPVLGIEPVAIDQCLLVDADRRAEEEQAEDPQPEVPRHLAADERPAAVQRCHQREVPREDEIERRRRGRQGLPEERCDQENRHGGSGDEPAEATDSGHPRSRRLRFVITTSDSTPAARRANSAAPRTGSSFASTTVKRPAVPWSAVATRFEKAARSSTCATACCT